MQRLEGCFLVMCRTPHASEVSPGGGSSPSRMSMSRIKILQRAGLVLVLLWTLPLQAWCQSGTNAEQVRRPCFEGSWKM